MPHCRGARVYGQEAPEGKDAGGMSLGHQVPSLAGEGLLALPGVTVHLPMLELVGIEVTGEGAVGAQRLQLGTPAPFSRCPEEFGDAQSLPQYQFFPMFGKKALALRVPLTYPTRLKGHMLVMS